MLIVCRFQLLMRVILNIFDNNLLFYIIVKRYKYYITISHFHMWQFELFFIIVSRFQYWGFSLLIKHLIISIRQHIIKCFCIQKWNKVGPHMIVDCMLEMCNLNSTESFEVVCKPFPRDSYFSPWKHVLRKCILQSSCKRMNEQKFINLG